MGNYHLYDRWLSMNIFKRKQVFLVNLSDCIDEFGFTFGKNGNHFFIKALAYNNDFAKAKSYLKTFYSENTILSVNQVIKKNIKSDIGNMYFCPWEENRIRLLSKFSSSHKIGPTPDTIIKDILIRLFDIYNKIKNEGFNQSFRLNGYPRCYQIKLNDQKSFYVPRDGQHRLAILSYLGVEKIKVCYEHDFWQQSYLLKFMKFLKTGNFQRSHKNHLKIIDPTQASEWPHVKQNNIDEVEAIKFFYKKFKLEKHQYE